MGGIWIMDGFISLFLPSFLLPQSVRRAAGEEEGPQESGPEEKVQEELRLLGVREEGPLHHPEDGQEAVVLLVRHHPRLLQHGLRRRRALQSTAVAHGIFA